MKLSMVKANERPQFDEPPVGYRDIYYEQSATPSVEMAEVALPDGQELFVTEPEQQYAFLIETHPNQANIYLSKAAEINQKNPGIISNVALAGLRRLSVSKKETN